MALPQETLDVAKIPLRISIHLSDPVAKRPVCNRVKGVVDAWARQAYCMKQTPKAEKDKRSNVLVEPRAVAVRFLARALERACFSLRALAGADAPLPDCEPATANTSRDLQNWPRSEIALERLMTRTSLEKHLLWVEAVIDKLQECAQVVLAELCSDEEQWAPVYGVLRDLNGDIIFHLRKYKIALRVPTTITNARDLHDAVRSALVGAGHVLVVMERLLAARRVEFERLVFGTHDGVSRIGQGRVDLPKAGSPEE